jgi:hypothetical protein
MNDAKEAITVCVLFTDTKYLEYLEKAKKVGLFDVEKEREYVCAARALKELKDELMEIWIAIC